MSATNEQKIICGKQNSVLHAWKMRVVQTGKIFLRLFSEQQTKMVNKLNSFDNYLV
jgi:hypothetical protein